MVCTFHAKLQSLIKDIKQGILGKIIAYLYTIEFQKCGLPHAHIIVFLSPKAKLRTPEQIDSLMSSEFPEDNEVLLDLIKKFMVHKPCRNQNSNAPCMVNGKCSKSFPKPFREETSVTEDSYASTRRSDTGRSYEVGGKQVNNQWVVCHSRYLIWKYHCYINVESIASVKAIKYIYKYVYKGHDRTTIEFGTCRDEIKLYLDACYISSCEAHWHLYFFGMQEQVPNVVRLQVHLPGEHSVVWNPEHDANLQEVVDRGAVKDTTLTAWFKANAEQVDENIRNILYQNFPSEMVWNKQECKWTKRQKGGAIGRMYYAHPSSGERFYLHLLLATVSSATSFDDLLTFEGIQYPSFREACIARGLLENDNEWHQCLEEARDMQIGQQLRHLFVTILHNCGPAHSRQLWNTFWSYICDDLEYHLQRQRIVANPSEEQVQDYGLYLIDQLFSHSGKRLSDWPTMP